MSDLRLKIWKFIKRLFGIKDEDLPQTGENATNRDEGIH